MTIKDYNKLKSHTDERFIKKLIDRAHQEQARVVAWQDVNGQKITVDLKIVKVNSQLNQIEFLCLSDESDEFNIVIANSEWIKIYIPSLAILGQAKLSKRVAGGRVTVSFPQMIAQVDRRQHLRLNLEEQDSLQAKCFFYKNVDIRFGIKEDVKTQYFEKYCHDISAGGISFIVSKQEEKFFKKKDEIVAMFIGIDGVQINVETKIVEKIQISPDPNNKLIYKGTKICLQFIELASEDQAFIDDFVFKNVKISEAS